MFFTIISKDTLDAVMTKFFQHLGLVSPHIDLDITSLKIRGDDVEIEAEVKEETLN